MESRTRLFLICIFSNDPADDVVHEGIVRVKHFEIDDRVDKI